MNPLQSIPAKIRLVMYWAGYLLGVVSGGITSIWAIIAASSPDISMPMGLVITTAVLTILTSQLNLLAGANVQPDTD